MLEYLINYCRHKLHSAAVSETMHAAEHVVSELIGLTIAIEAIIYFYGLVASLPSSLPLFCPLFWAILSAFSALSCL